MRMIDADALKKTLEDMCSASNNIKQRRVEDIMLHNIFPQIIDDEPTIEVEPVKHGRWIDFPECLAYEGALDAEDFVCSECHHVWNTVDNCAETFRYCPNCGSKNEDGDTDD